MSIPYWGNGHLKSSPLASSLFLASILAFSVGLVEYDSEECEQKCSSTVVKNNLQERTLYVD